ncbi:MAG: VIT domain-containing protein [Acidobacteriota bacterium]
MDHSSFTMPKAGDSRGLVAVDGRTFPLRSVRFMARARGGLALTRLVQRYENPWNEPLDVIYVMPLPADGAVLDFTVRLGERVIRSEVESVDQAREDYERALVEGRSAGIVEQERSDTFVQRLGNLPPGAVAEIELSVLHPLGFDGAGRESPAWEYRFPTVTGVRYHGAPGRVPDADRLDTARARAEDLPVRAELDLLVEDGEPDAVRPAADAHTLAVEPSAAATRVTLAEPAPLDRDLVVRWRAAAEGQAAAVRFASGPGRPGDDGRYGLLTMTPPPDAGRAAIRRDLTLLLDASGSMHGAPLAAAKRIAHELLRSLDRADRFRIVAFSHRPEPLTDGLRPATPDEIGQACRTLDRLEAGGGTEIVQALHDTLVQLRPDAQHQVVLLTDGYIGFEQEAVAEVLHRAPAGCRVHVAAVGSAPNRTLSTGLSRAGRGVEVIASGDDGVARAARRLVDATAGPVLEEVQVSGDAVVAVAPERPRDVLAGAASLVAVELAPAGGTLRVTARSADGSRWERSIDVPPADQPGDGATGLPLGALFARERVADLEMALAAAEGTASKELLEEIEQTALRHGIVSLRTSLVAISEEPAVDPTAPRRRVRLATGLPAGVSAEGVGLARHARIMATREMPAFPYFMGAAEFPMSASQRLVGLDGRRSSRREASARIVLLERDRLVLEFDVVNWAVEVPEGEVTIRLRDPEGTVDLPARIDPDGSTGPGCWFSGRTIRLVLLFAEDPTPGGGCKDIVGRALASGEGTVEIIPVSDPRPAMPVMRLAPAD